MLGVTEWIKRDRQRSSEIDRYTEGLNELCLALN